MKREESIRSIIIDYCNSHGITPTEFARNSGISKSYMSKINKKQWGKTGISMTYCALLAAGINGYIIETPNEFKIEINALELFDTMVTENEAVLAAEQFLPAHLTYVFDFRKSQWLELEAQDLTFDEIDAKDLTWEQFDGA